MATDGDDPQQFGTNVVPSVSWGDLPGVPPVLREFADAPAGFMVGVLLNVLVGGLETVVTAFIDAVLFVYEGDTVGSTQGMLGLADIPRVIASVLSGAGDLAGSSFLGVLSSLFEIVESALGVAGPGAPILAAVVMGLFVIAAAYAVRAVWTLLVDSVNPL